MTQPEKPRPPKVRNPHTQALNRRESLWQIAAPLAVAVVAAVTLMALAASPAGARSRSAFADVSLILLIVPAAVAGLALLALLCGLGVGVWYARRELPYLFKQAQDILWRVAQETKTYSGRVAHRVMAVHALNAAARAVLADLRSLFQSGR